MREVSTKKVEKVIEAADALRAKGERVSYRSVNARLRDNGGWGCSNSDIRDTLRAWVRDENYDVVLETSGLPRAVSAAMAKAVLPHGPRHRRNSRPSW